MISATDDNTSHVLSDNNVNHITTSNTDRNNNSNILNTKSVNKTIKKQSNYEVNNYTELYNTIESIKTNKTCDNPTITLNKGNYTINQSINWGDSSSAKNLTICGGKDLVVINGQKTSQFINVSCGYTLNLMNFYIQYTKAVNGSAINNNGNVTLKNISLYQNQATGNGIIYNNGNMTITDSNLGTNTITANGTIFNCGNLTITNSTALSNTAYKFGGVVYNKAILQITNSNFTNNKANMGGVIYNEKTANTMINTSNFNRNRADKYGAIVYNLNETFIYNSNFTSQQTQNGAIAYNNRSHMFIDNCNFINNQAPNGGNGAITSNYNAYVVIQNSRFNNNTAYNGAINYNTQRSVVNIINSNFTNNNASFGGINYNYMNSQLNLINSTLKDNYAFYGGVNYNIGSNITIQGSNFISNSAKNGGCNYNNKANLTILNSTFTQNKGRGMTETDLNTNGSTIYNMGGNVSITTSNFTDNLANMGGVIYNNGSIKITYSNFTNNIQYQSTNQCNITIYTTCNFILHDTNITINYGSLGNKTQLYIYSPIINEQLNLEENVTFMIDGSYNEVTKDQTTNQVYMYTYFGIYQNQITSHVEYLKPMENTNITLNFDRKASIYDMMDNITIKSCTNTTIVAQLKDKYSNIIQGNVDATIKINNKVYATTTIKDGLLNTVIPTANLSANTYTLKIITNENTLYNSATIVTKITVVKRNISDIILPNVTIKTFTNHTLVAQIKDEQGELLHKTTKICAKINGVTYLHSNITDGLLHISLKTDTLRPSTYNITIILGENNFYNTKILNYKLTLIKRNVNMIATTNNATTYGNLLINTVVSDIDDHVVNDGFVLFKINGCTLKDDNGNDIHVYLDNNHAFLNYSIPFSMSGITYKLEVVYNGGYKFNNLRINTTFTLTKRLISPVEIEPIVQLTQTNTNIKLTLHDIDNKPIKGINKICVKINGVTHINTNIKNGIINLTLPTNTFKQREYDVLIRIGENSVYKQCDIQFKLNIINRNATIKTKQNTPIITNNTLKLNTQVTTPYKIVNDGFITYKIDDETITENKTPIKVNITNGYANFTYKLSEKYKTGIHNITTTYHNSYYNTITDVIQIKI